MRFSVENDMDPRPMPAQLPTLTKVEEMILALVHPVISVYRVTGGQWKGGEVHCISFFQDPKDVFTTVPRLLSEVNVIIIRKAGENIAHHQDFQVNRQRLLIWIQFLRRYNKWYKDVGVDNTALEEYDRLADDLQSQYEIEENSMDVDGLISGPNSMSAADREAMEDARGFIHTGALRSVSSINERATLQQLLNARPVSQESVDSERQQELSQVVIDYPAIREEPINEFSTDGYIVRAFPGLFPYGNCDLRDNSARLVKVANSEYFKHLLRYKDGRFGKDPRFVQFMLNSRLR